MNMKLLWLLCVLQLVCGQVPSNTPYLKNSRLCHQWTCVNTKLGLPDLPSKDVAKTALTRILPQGAWQDVLEKTLDICYGSTTRRYTNTCLGQALLHCVVDQMINNCPEESWRKDDACSPVSSLAGFKHMFSLSRYDNLEKNLLKERRPKWFLQHYFDQKCCDLPTMFNSSVLRECGFTSFISYYEHGLRKQDSPSTPTPQVAITNGEDKVQMVSLNQTTTTKPLESDVDPLDCCDMTEFIQRSWRSECGFHLNWNGNERLVIANYTPEVTTLPPVTTTANTNPRKDLMLLPHSCSQETCVFKKLGIVEESGLVDSIAFRRMLDNFTDAHPSWKKPASRVMTRCLGRGTRDYEGSCEINKILACTLDVLTENCPYKKKSEDLCKHNKRKSGCQISSSRFRPKNRREICLLPPLVELHDLFECGLESIYKTDHVTVPEPKPKKHFWSSHNLCQDQKPSTTCIMGKMGVLNKYEFMDYFKMKDRIRQFTTNQPVWSGLLDIVMSAYINIPMYSQHCSSQKKLLNVVDAMLLTCPVSKRRDTTQCKQFFRGMTDTPPISNQNSTRLKIEQLMKHYHHIFLQNSYLPPKVDPVIRKYKPNIVKKPIFNYGILDTGNTPQVTVINIKPAVVTRPDKPLVLAPVYLRNPQLRMAPPTRYNNDFGSSRPYWLHDRRPLGRFTTPVNNISTKSTISANEETTTLQIPI